MNSWIIGRHFIIILSASFIYDLVNEFSFAISNCILELHWITMFAETVRTAERDLPVFMVYDKWLFDFQISCSSWFPKKWCYVVFFLVNKVPFHIYLPVDRIYFRQILTWKSEKFFITYFAGFGRNSPSVSVSFTVYSLTPCPRICCGCISPQVSQKNKKCREWFRWCSTVSLHMDWRKNPWGSIVKCAYISLYNYIVKFVLFELNSRSD